VNSINLKRISEILGLSVSTISRALKDHPEISKKTKKKVVDLAKSLDYEPNLNAINLRTSNSKLFGVIVPSITNTFYTSFIAAVEEECRKKGFSLLILQSGDDPTIELTNLKICKQNRITGLFVCLSPNTTDVDAFVRLSKNDVPVIFYDKVPELINCNKVCVADASSANLAANFILQKKKKNVLGIFGNTNLLMTRKRLDAFTRTINEKENKITLTINYALSSAEAESITLKHLAKQKVDAVFCMSDEVLTGVIKAVQKKGLQMPNDIGIITISNGDMPHLYFPEITYVETSGFKLGKLAFSSMLSCLGGSTFIRDISIESILVEGGSI
jgi:LacI family transcriptional regulator